jgi:hypothetical protein
MELGVWGGVDVGLWKYLVSDGIILKIRRLSGEIKRFSTGIKRLLR